MNAIQTYTPTHSSLQTLTHTDTPTAPYKGLYPKSRQELMHCRGTARGSPGQTGRLCPLRTGRMAQMGGWRWTDWRGERGERLNIRNSQTKTTKYYLSED